MKFQQLDTHADRLKLMDQLKSKFFERAGQIDVEGLFPFENITELQQSGYTSLTVPHQYGGMGISLAEMLMLQEKIAEGDGATALSIGWHMGIIKNLTEKRTWSEPIFKKICEDVLNGSLINAAATEPQTGSPTRGGRPFTSAVEQNGGWTITGRKSFTTMAPVLNYFIVSASLEDGGVGNFLIPREVPGLSIEETWDSIGLRGTGSHDLVLENVRIDKEFMVEKIQPGQKQANGWLLHIPACYLGIAQAARTYAINFAAEYSPSSITGSIVELPNVQQKIGEMELLLLQSRHFLYSVANLWDERSDSERRDMQPELSAVKHSVTNSALAIVDLAMRIVGAKSLSLKCPLQRYYRDVRAGLHNPPMDDMTISLLARSAIQSITKP
ncbi:acyl-CoA dehydrogenase family protein [Neobacillus sp. LXY-4]|uniref:acyl-CoA dehydrogenase family protein n=1 Tax=Neobacillus sp. LXY-4 TaxID=3379826 RepID=UPI003EDFBA10